jgi:hypothetical protein
MENQIFERILSESKTNKKIIGIRMFGSSDDFWCGYVVDYNSEVVIIQHFTKFGMKDGLIIEKVENIESIDSDDDYSIAFEYLTANGDKITLQNITNVPISYSGDWKVEIMQHCRSNELIVTLGMRNETRVTGFIKELNEEMVRIAFIEKLGETESISYFRMSEIESIHLETMEDRKRRLLYDWNNRIKK